MGLSGKNVGLAREISSAAGKLDVQQAQVSIDAFAEGNEVDLVIGG